MPQKFILKNQLADSAQIKKIINPYSNEAVAEVYISSDSHFNAAADYLTTVQKKYKSLPIYKKKELLYKISETLSKRKNEIAKLITLETGKPVKFSLIEAERAVLTFRLGAEECSRIPGEILPLDLLKGSENKMGIVKRFPIGLILGITPWNFPINLVAHKVSPALASFNTILLKPSSNSLLCGIEIGKIILEICSELEIGFTPVNVLTLSGGALENKVSDDRIKLVSFTGSSYIGWGIKKKTNRQKVSLELGGNAGVIVEQDADIDSAVAKITISGFSAAGQSCISVQRVYIHEKIYDEFRAKITEASKKIKFGNPNDEDTISGPMITEEEAIRAEKWINESRQSGANILIGGGRNGAVLEPTIIENASDSSHVKCDEVFAPVITIDRYKNFEDAVDEVNNSRYGLQAGIFTNDIRKIMYAYNTIHAGGVIINEASSYRMDSMPYGGAKDSGNAREGVSYAIKEMSEEKILVL